MPYKLRELLRPQGYIQDYILFGFLYAGKRRASFNQRLPDFFFHRGTIFPMFLAISISWNNPPWRATISFNLINSSMARNVTTISILFFAFTNRLGNRGRPL